MVGAQVAGDGGRLEEVDQGRAVGLVAVLEPEQGEDGRPDVGVVGPHVARPAEVLHAGADEAEPRAGDVLLDVTVAVGEVVVDARVAATAWVGVGHEVVGKGEGSEVGRALRIGVDHVQGLFRHWIGDPNKDGRGRAAQIRIGCLDAHHVPFHLAQRRIGAHGVAVDIERRRGVAVDRKARGPGRELRLDVEVDLADLVRGAGRGRCPGAVRVRPGEGAIRLPYPVSSGEVVALVRGELEQRVRLVDAVRSEAGEKRAEGFVVVVQLLHVVGFAGP